MDRKSRKKPELIRRHEACVFVLAKYRRRSCDFVRADCVRLSRTLLVKRGHRGLAQLPRYRSLGGARRALRRAGYGSLAEMIDAVLPGRAIAPAMMLPGDLALVDGEFFGQALLAYLGDGAFLGWMQGEAEAAVIEAHAIRRAWRT